MRSISPQEQQVLFRKHPMLMGFASDWAGAGDFRTDDYAGLPILIVRGRDGKLRAFLNVCRHRGAKVAQGCGKARLFSCPYHAWTYDLAGKVMGIPDERCFPDVRAERSSLAELPLCEKHGLVWVIPTRRRRFDELRHRSMARRARGRARFVRASHPGRSTTGA